jgi:hypothetical protein
VKIGFQKIFFDPCGRQVREWVEFDPVLQHENVFVKVKNATEHSTTLAAR